MENITSGDIIQGARWPEPVQVELVEEVNQGAYVRVVGVTRHSRMHVDQLLVLATWHIRTQKRQF